MALVISFPFVVWFGLSILEYWPSVIGFAIVWVAMILYWQFVPCEPLKVEFEKRGMTAHYRKGTKDVQYGGIARIVWEKDFAGGGLTFWMTNGDIVVFAGLNTGLVDEVMRNVGEARPDLGLGPAYQGLMSSSWGVVADSEYKDGVWRTTWIQSFDYEYFFWGRRPRKSADVGPHILNIRGGSRNSSEGHKIEGHKET